MRSSSVRGTEKRDQQSVRSPSPRWRAGTHRIKSLLEIDKLDPFPTPLLQLLKQASKQRLERVLVALLMHVPDPQDDAFRISALDVECCVGFEVERRRGRADC